MEVRLLSVLHRLLRKTKIKSRLIFTLLLLTTIPIILSGTYSYIGASKAIKTKISTYSAEIMKQLRKNEQLENKKYIILSDSIMLNENVQNFILQFNTLDEASKKEMSVFINTLLGDNLDLLQKIKSVRISAPDSSVIYDMGFNSISDKDSSRLIERIDRDEGGDQWSYLTTEQGEPCIVLARKINSLQKWDVSLGYIFIGISESLYSNDLYADIDMGAGTDIFILDHNGKVISSRNPDIPIQQPFQDEKLMASIREQEAESNPSFLTEIGDERHLVAYSYDMYSNWYLISAIPDSYLNNETQSIQRNIMLLCCVLIVVSLCIALIISNTIYKPLTMLMEQTSRIIRGNLNTSIVDPSKDEIGYLTDKFNVMVGKINALLEETKREQHQKREIELQMLQAQINPHFLFNTLNSLKWTAQLSQAESVSVGLSALAELLRNTIVDKKEFVSIKDELRNIDNYVRIQKVRYGSTFEVKTEMDEGTESCKVPKFFLQPIVENSIIHGQEGISHNLLIHIHCRIDGDDLKITITDNGRGMSQETADKLLQGGREKEKGRLANIGISNVNERIRLNFGEEYGLMIHSKEKEGTTVFVTLPRLMMVEGAEEDIVG